MIGLEKLSDGVSDMLFRLLEPKDIKAEFLGQDGSCDFHTGQTYELWMLVDRRERICISRPSWSATVIPYDTEEAFRKNWKVIS